VRDADLAPKQEVPYNEYGMSLASRTGDSCRRTGFAARLIPYSPLKDADKLTGLVREMRPESTGRNLFSIALILLLVLAGERASSQCQPARVQQRSESASERQIQIPSRASTSLFEGTQGKQKPEIYFDPTTGMVTLKLLVQDPNGYFIPNIRRDNFVVYENGVRQQNVSVDIEHAAVTLGVLIEFGGRTQVLDRMMSIEVARTGRQLLDALGPQDKIAIWKYNDKVEKVSDFTPAQQDLGHLFDELGEPQFSETNLYDAVIAIMQEMRPVKGRKAIILISSGIDTFSKATLEDALNAAGSTDTPIYVISTMRVLRDLVNTYESTGPLAHIDWEKANRNLETIATASGGRVYSPATTIDLSAIYDDMMENLRLRYVIKYRSSTKGDMNLPRTVCVELVDPKTGGPLKIVDQSGRTVRAKVIAQQSYVPLASAGP
jgi:Ca-activated chloride channel homolog